MFQVELKVLEGRQQGKTIPLNVRQFLIGREQDCHLRPNSDLVSRHHCVFTVDDFTINEQAGAVTCPAGITRPVTPGRNVIFGAACGGCPLRQRCTTSKTGRTLSLHPHHGLLRAARAAWTAGPGLREDYMAHRPNVERAIAQVATWRGRRVKLRYRGVTKNNAWLKRRTAALNLRNLASRGLTRHDGAWVLAI